MVYPVLAQKDRRRVTFLARGCCGMYALALRVRAPYMRVACVHLARGCTCAVPECAAKFTWTTAGAHAVGMFGDWEMATGDI